MFKEITITAACGHKVTMGINTALPQAIQDKLVNGPKDRPCIHCQAGHPERGQK